MALLDAEAVDSIGVAVAGEAEPMLEKDDCWGVVVTTRDVVRESDDRDNVLVLAVELVAVVGVVSVTTV